MSSKLPIRRAALAAAATSAVAVLASTGVTRAAEFLIDLGNNSSYRGASVVSPDANGNTWTSVWSGAFYQDIRDSAGNTTPVDFGFTSPGGTDSYNGPAGVDPDTGNPNPPSSSVFDAAALGDLGVNEAVFDYYTNSTFQIQNLDPTMVYDLTFFGSHKYNTVDNTTRYTVYTDDTFSTPVASADLLVGVDADNNLGNTATISGLSPQANDILYVGFRGATGGDGYLNALRIQERAVPEPAVAVSLVGLGLAAAARRRRPA